MNGNTFRVFGLALGLMALGLTAAWRKALQPTASCKKSTAPRGK